MAVRWLRQVPEHGERGGDRRKRAAAAAASRGGAAGGGGGAAARARQPRGRAHGLDPRRAAAPHCLPHGRARRAPHPCLPLAGAHCLPPGLCPPRPQLTRWQALIPLISKGAMIQSAMLANGLCLSLFVLTPAPLPLLGMIPSVTSAKPAEQ